MGRQKYSNKIDVEQVSKIDIRWLRKQNYLDGRWGLGETDSIRFQIATQHNSAGIFDYDYIRFFLPQTFWNGESGYITCDVRLTTTPCNYGRQRYWFVCPNLSCRKRVGILYLQNNCIGCRHCHDLTYRSKYFNEKSKNYEFIHLANVMTELFSLTENLRSRYYAGKPTRKFRKFIRYQNKNKRYLDLWIQEINNNPHMFE